MDAFTKELHTEDDCTSTIIHVPNQQMDMDNNLFHFQFALGEKLNISIRLKESNKIMFCAKLLTHRQTSDIKSHDCKFVNFGYYRNRKLFNHIRGKFIRNKE